MTKDSFPSAPDAEIGVCGSVLKSPPSIVEAKRLRPSDFIDQHCATFFAVASDFHRRGLPLDPLAMAGELASKSPFASTVDVAEFFGELADKVFTAANVTYYVGLVAESSRKRRLLAMGVQLCEAARNGQASNSILNDFLSDASDMQREATGETLLADALPMSEFAAADHRIEYLIPGVIVAGQPGVISAKSKSLKTTIALDACISMATGSAFLNHWRIPSDNPEQIPKQIPCGIISAESGAATIAETIKRICDSKGVDPEELSTCYISTRCPRLQSVEWLDEIRRFIEANDLRCLMVDPTYLALAGINQNNLAEVAAALSPIGGIVQTTGCSIIMVHHNRKVTASPYGCPTLEEITGSGFAEWSRFWILLGKRREWDEETGRHWLWLVAGGSAGFGARKWLDVREGRQSDVGGRVWEPSVVSASEGESQEKQAAARQREQEREAKAMEWERAVVDALRKEGGQASKQRIAERLGAGPHTIAPTLVVLLDRGDIVPCRVKIESSNRTCEGYSLSEMEGAA